MTTVLRKILAVSLIFSPLSFSSASWAISNECDQALLPAGALGIIQGVQPAALKKPNYFMTQAAPEKELKYIVSRNNIDQFKESLSQEERTTIFYYLLDHPDTLFGRLMKEAMTLYPFYAETQKIYKEVVNQDYGEEIPYWGGKYTNKYTWDEEYSGSVIYRSSKGGLLSSFLREDGGQVFYNILMALIEMGASKRIEIVKDHNKLYLATAPNQFSENEFIEKKWFYKDGKVRESINESNLKETNENIFSELSHLRDFAKWMSQSQARQEYAKILIELGLKVVDRFTQENRAEIQSPAFRKAIANYEAISVLTGGSQSFFDKIRDKSPEAAIRNSKLLIGHMTYALPTSSASNGAASAIGGILYYALDTKAARKNAVLMNKTSLEKLETEDGDYYGSVEDIKNLALSYLTDLSGFSDSVQEHNKSIEKALSKYVMGDAKSFRKEDASKILKEIEGLSSGLAALLSDQDYFNKFYDQIMARADFARNKLEEKNVSGLDRVALEEFDSFVAEFKVINDGRQQEIGQKIAQTKARISAAKMNLMKALK